MLLLLGGLGLMRLFRYFGYVFLSDRAICLGLSPFYVSEYFIRHGLDVLSVLWRQFLEQFTDWMVSTHCISPSFYSLPWSGDKRGENS